MDHFIQQCSEIVSTNPERPQFSIVIIYENVVSAARALRACEILRHEIPEDLSIDVSVWKTGILECQENRTKAALNSSTADVVIVAASGRDEISPYFRLWVEEWLELERERECALFTLFGDHITPHAVATAAYLRQKTAPLGMDFFSHPFLDPQEISTPREFQPLLSRSASAVASDDGEWDEWRPGLNCLANGDCEVSAYDIIENFGSRLREHLERMRVEAASKNADISWEPGEVARNRVSY